MCDPKGTHTVVVIIYILVYCLSTMCLIGKTQLLCMQCRGIGPHLVARGKSHGFSRVAAGTCGTFSSYDGDAHSKRELVY